uniref:Uncharacterized protein n=1 Tax=Timema bartmani TaxID=61472 RepID=A0A7R9EPS6_9NEOP|nr:unnamed protein product [Timema bartmani]
MEMWAEVGKVVVEYITYLCTKITIDSQSAMTSGCLEQIEGSYVKKVCACRSYAGQVPCNSVSHPITNIIILLVTAITILYDFIVTPSSKVRSFSWANASECVKISYKIPWSQPSQPAGASKLVCVIPEKGFETKRVFETERVFERGENVKACERKFERKQLTSIPKLVTILRVLWILDRVKSGVKATSILRVVLGGSKKPLQLSILKPKPSHGSPLMLKLLI